MRTAAVVLAMIIMAAQSWAHTPNPEDAGVIESVIAGSPAESAGMRAGDRLIAIDGRRIANQDDLRAVLDRYEPGATVPLAIERDGQPVELRLTFGARPDGGVSIGVRINLAMGQGAIGEGEEGTTECLAWIEKTYRIDAAIRGLEPGLAAAYEAARECVGRDARRMTSADAVRFCDNVFKVHCSGIDLLTEIGEAQVERCEKWLDESLGLRPGRFSGWTTCAEQKIYERYTVGGEMSDAGACRAALLDECGVNIDAEIRGERPDPARREFAECCRADRFADDRGASGVCPMIDERFERGPCHDYPVCINRLNSEWIHCAASE